MARSHALRTEPQRVGTRSALQGQRVTSLRVEEVTIILLLAASGCATSGSSADPEAARGYLEEGRAVAKRGDHLGAVSLYGKAIAANPEFPEAYYERGRSKVRLRRDPVTQGDVRAMEEDAYRDYSLALKYNPAYADAYFNRAMLLSSRAQYRAATEDLLNASRFNAKDPEAHYYIGWLYETYFQDKLALAYQHYEKYVELGGPDPEVGRKVALWKQMAPAGTAEKPSKAPTPEEEQKARELHQELMKLLKDGKKDEASKAFEKLMAGYGHTRYVQDQIRALEALRGYFKK